MILRRLTEHVRTQNWLAVALDFVIVVMGVFIGIQVSNWNNGLAERRAYMDARMRLAVEVDDNITDLTSLQTELRESVPRVSSGLDALLACATGPDAEATILAAVDEVQLTRGIRLRTNSLKEITENAALLRQQSEEDRRAFQNLRHVLGIMQYESDFVEIKPLDHPIWSHSGLVFSAADYHQETYRGIEWRLLRRRLSFREPLDVACKDPSLHAQLYEWERLQGALEYVVATAIAELTTVEQLLGDEQTGAE